MRTAIKLWIVRLLALVTISSAALAQDRVPFRQEELDQMLAPVALYPDALLTQLLMASTYPLEVVQAARWSRDNPGLKGRDAVRAVERLDWDVSVKSMTAFPQVLDMMDEKIEWTEDLGEAFLAQQADVLDTIQQLRKRAEAAGNLRSSDQMQVERQGEFIAIRQPAPEVVYVPYYNPFVVYGTWWWPAYPPVYWAPSPAYYAAPAYRSAFIWGGGIFISAGFFFGHTDWHQRQVTVVNHITVNRTVIVDQPRTQVAWQHDPGHRRGVPFRNEQARQRFEQSRLTAAQRPAAADVAPVQRRDDNRTTEMRQRQFEGHQDHRVPRGDRTDATVNRPAQSRAGADIRERQPEARAAQPAQLPAQVAVQASEQRQESGNTSPSQPRGAAREPLVAAPASRPVPVATPPHHANPPKSEQRFDSGRRPETRAGGDPGQVARHSSTPPRENASLPRPQAVAPNPAPRMEQGPRQPAQVREAPQPQATAPNAAPRAEFVPRGGGPRNQGNQRESSGRGNDRKS